MFDWSLDLAFNDSNSVCALPCKNGVYRPQDSLGKSLFQYLKTSAKFFKKEVFNGKNFDDSCGWTYVGDAWLKSLDWNLISDWYKDSYNQRPHFMKEYFAVMVGLPTSADTLIRWDKSFERDIETAKKVREDLEKGLTF